MSVEPIRYCDFSEILKHPIISLITIQILTIFPTSSADRFSDLIFLEIHDVLKVNSKLDYHKMLSELHKHCFKRLFNLRYRKPLRHRKKLSQRLTGFLNAMHRNTRKLTKEFIPAIVIFKRCLLFDCFDYVENDKKK